MRLLARAGFLGAVVLFAELRVAIFFLELVDYYHTFIEDLLAGGRVRDLY